METTDITTDMASTVGVTNLSELTLGGCTQEVLDFEPSCREFLEIMGLGGWALLGLATITYVTLLVVFTDTVIHVIKYCHVQYKETTAIVLTVYPVLGLCSYLGLLFQKANLFLDAAAQLWFAFCMYQFLTLTLKYFGGETRFVEKAKGTVMPWRSPPCCCWPCCICLCPKGPISKKQIRFVKILVMQHPWVQLVFSILGLTLWLEGWYTHTEVSATDAYIYIFVASSVSFLFGLWAFIVGFKASLPQLQEFHYTPKIITFQLCLVFLRLQALIVNSILVPSGAIPCLPPLSPRVFANVILNSLLLGQLLVLVIVARHYYKLPTRSPILETQEAGQEKTNSGHHLKNGVVVVKVEEKVNGLPSSNEPEQENLLP
ncbi:organic solute transporter subunit alpha-like [Eriocheir sinensis]|uniref:organic solute transporter subunit alpha-like n=1 Tax=Eriocheir sinensis TaxID=95602 RepID=UPI0021C5FC73|nr:organic solute transporter subunit alpha-like [Eriocheir sinensis]XP_050711892.1 organic solute transporter subunit alpha-like [Eriocheir sinensis]XP_050711894.1 organic solute transporter subunit alpha-like [Eriocheir sinensis]XP_050711895.1 organic solute transporter subunit alpha-like [Eriocheir sinensis]